MESLSKWFFSSPQRILQPDISETEMDLVRASWRKVEPNKIDHGVLLFRRLFEIAPHLRDLFPFGQDLTSPLLRSHALNVMSTVGTAVELLDQSDQLVPALQRLARTHAFLELTAKEFQLIGESLLWVFESQLGHEFTSDTRAAWTTVYGFISDTMLEVINKNSAEQTQMPEKY